MKLKNIEDIYPLSPTQAGILFHSIREPQSGVYFQQYTCVLSGRLDVAAFEQAWQRVVDRHPVLRTAFLWEGLDQPLQVVRQRVDVAFDYQDWQALSPGAQRTRLEAWLKEDRKLGFELARAPLTRLTLVRMAPDQHHLIWSFHHLVSDGWSTPMILREVFAFYEAFRSGQERPLKQPRPYRDYIAWLQEQDLSEAERFWKRELGGFTTPTRLPVSINGGCEPELVRGYHEQELSLPSDTTRALQALAHKNRLTLNTLVQGAWAVLLSRYSGEQDVVYGAIVSGRPADLAGVEEMVGLFINALPVRVRVLPGQELLSWLKGLQAHQLEIRQYEFSPLAEIQSWSNIPPGQPLFDSLVVFENYPVDGSSFQGNEYTLEVGQVRYFEQSNYPLSVLAVPGPELVVHIIYDRACCDDDTVSRILGHLQTVLSSMASHPTQPLSDIPLLTAQERHQLMVEWNDTRTEYPRVTCIHHLIEEQAAQKPTAIAVQFGDQQLSYRDLDSRANRVAHHLCAQGVGPGDLVGICLERSVELVVAVVGVLKSGAAYVPLDPIYPQERLAFVLAETQAPVLLTQQYLAGRLPHHPGQVICLDTDWPTIAQQSDQKPASDVTAEDLVYVIYTSGSTGKPKGVQIAHSNLVNSTQARLDYYPEPVSSFLLMSSFAFDSSMVGIFGTLCQGGTLILPAPGDEQDVQKLAGLIHRHQVTDTLCLPSVYNLILAYAQADQLDSLKTVIVAGEACPQDVVQRHYQRLPQTALYNEYGPTEATVWSTVYQVPATGVETPVPIGRPIANTHVFILDRHRQPVPIGVPGELYIGGDGLARGYLNQPELTAESFIPSPFQGESNSCLYKTGDLACYLPDGNIQFLGRVDHQVKIRGYRVELDEIQLALNRHPQVCENVVVAWESERGQQLVAYFVPASELAPNREELRSFLQAKLPEYMLPTAFISLEALPVTPNGKVDRHSLPKPDEVVEAEEDAFVPPHTDTEATIAQIWSELLGLSRVGRHENFFSLGGHSLLAMQLVARLRNVFQVQLPMNSVFEKPTPAGTAKQIETLLWARNNIQQPTEAKSDSEREEFEI